MDYTDPLFSTDWLYSKYKLLRFYQINDYLTGQTMYKAFFNQSPIPVQSIFTRNDDIHSYDTRQSNDFHPPQPKSNLLKKQLRLTNNTTTRKIR